ncbi:aminopeptidase [Thiohalorhabdus denitrificans]|uniref:Aminopeptidase N n=1 Tax=Thiohalorhabdus denitrificans TaxID=381306 RepID=A0A0P9EBP4_9GAMM|nr:aminopeptidase N [Thiohalorhabdus denitrificans]KPV39684.1 aminopeptidase [Thiohalorhabdus denitrificans]SCX94067.1 aminopeptidase N [Thiohalorhabdus denitrificans]
MADSRQQQSPRPVRLAEYTPPAHLVDTVQLRFELGEEWTTVSSRLTVRANPERIEAGPLVLDGRELELLEVAVDGRPLGEGEYALDAESLTIPEVPERFTLEVTTRIRPQENTALEGLYKSSGTFCTQCEPEGFRRITYFPDRSDVMARYTTTIVADAQRYPVLLSNGNRIGAGTLTDGRHWVQWEDPFPKPSYLFALVGGDLARVADSYTTMSGRQVALHIYVEHGNEDKVDHAMRSLKEAMAWDEATYGRECDLDVYQIVAVEDFNMGAMENKGLNIFNTSAILAKPETATDADFQRIEAIIGHEYFHNWSGNRVTLRDWFQLSLKEGFTVFREQHFSADRYSAPVQRIEDVRRLRTAQFPEDDGPTAHPVRPDSYIEISNFYTPTVYEKGAEVVRMMYHLLGPEDFRRGTDLFFASHDGRAVTTEDFVRALEEASDRDLSQFRLWYTQAGTPRLFVDAEHDPGAATYTLHVRQEVPETPGQAHKQPMHIPVAVGLLDRAGNALPLRMEGEEPGGTTRVLELREAEQSFTFTGVGEDPVPSLLRGFSAPVRLEHDHRDQDLAFLLAHDEDLFTRWEAGQELACRSLFRGVAAYQAGDEMRLDETLVEAFGGLLRGDAGDKALVAEALTQPDEGYLADLMDWPVDPEAIHQARRFTRARLAQALGDDFLYSYQANQEGGEYRPDPGAIARRRLKNLSLAYLVAGGVGEGIEAAREQVHTATNMTDRLGALRPMVAEDVPGTAESLEAFYTQWKDEPEVMDKWFAIQATSPHYGTLAGIRRLLEHPAFNFKNPNKVRAVLGAFARGNPYRFHAPDGEAYTFFADQVLRLDRINPQMAAALARAFSRFRRYDEARQRLMREQLERIRQDPQLSRDTFEIVTKSLGAEENG